MGYTLVRRRAAKKAVVMTAFDYLEPPAKKSMVA
jgi:hypothetical protein